MVCSFRCEELWSLSDKFRFNKGLGPDFMEFFWRECFPEGRRETMGRNRMKDKPMGRKILHNYLPSRSTREKDNRV